MDILTQMQALAKTLPEYSLVREMPCIGDTLAPRLIAEIGDVRRFHSKRALIAYAGIDAPPYQSGKFCANNRHISKRGNRYLRKTGYEVMQSYVMHKPANDPIFTFIEKKRGEGKSGKLAMVAGLNTHVHMQHADCRISAKRPICFNTFIKFVFKNFYPNCCPSILDDLKRLNYSGFDIFDKAVICL